MFLSLSPYCWALKIHITLFFSTLQSLVIELVLNHVRNIYVPNNKLLKRYTQVVLMLISNLLSFNITHVNRENNSMADKLFVFATPLTRQLLPHKPNCTFQYLYFLNLPNNIESWQVFPSEEAIFTFIQNEPFKPK
jgi:hypothetical protein